GGKHETRRPQFEIGNANTARRLNTRPSPPAPPGRVFGIFGFRAFVFRVFVIRFFRFGLLEMTMSFALSTLCHDRQRFLPGVLAVAFSAVLIALQCGLLLGLFSITSLPIDETRADVWVGHPEVPSVDLGRPIPARWQSFLSFPEVERT